VSGIHGVEALLHQVEPFDEAVRRIRAVQCAEVLQAARTYLDGRQIVVVTIGPPAAQGPETAEAFR
jgi:predicted Zn-dependent peptidase